MPAMNVCVSACVRACVYICVRVYVERVRPRFSSLLHLEIPCP